MERWRHTLAFHAVRLGDLDLLQNVVQGRRSFIFDTDYDGASLLIHCAKNGNLPILKWLIYRGADVTMVDNAERTALLHAGIHGSLTTVQWLLSEGGGNIRDRCMRSETILHHAAIHGHLDIVIWLVNKGLISVAETNVYGHTVLMCATHAGQLVVVQWLLLHGHACINDKDDDGRSLLHIAILSESLAVTQWLVCHTSISVSDRSHDGKTALLHAAGKCINITRWLLDRAGASMLDKDDHGANPLHFAVSHFDVSDVEWLADQHHACITETDDEGFTPIHYAALHDRVSTTTWLLIRGAICEADPTLWVILLTLPEYRWMEWLSVIPIFHPIPTNSVIVWTPLQKKMIQKGTRIGKRLPWYKEQRRVAVQTSCLLPTSLSDLILAYVDFSSVDEMWSTQLLQTTQKRPLDESTLRRSKRIAHNSLG